MSKEERFEYIQDSYHLFMAWIFDYRTDKEYNTNNKNDMEDMTKLLNEQDQKIADLETKLAEKEEEIKQLNNRILFSQLQAPKEQILNIVGSQCIQYNPKQAKINYAVEQLNKAKYLITQEYRFDVEESDFAVAYEDDIDKIFDQLITEIKEGK